MQLLEFQRLETLELHGDGFCVRACLPGSLTVLNLCSTELDCQVALNNCRRAFRFSYGLLHSCTHIALDQHRVSWLLDAL